MFHEINTGSSRRMRHDVSSLIHALDNALVDGLRDTDGAETDVYTAMRDAVLHAGERLCPRILIAAASASHGGPLDGDTADLVLRAAVAVEYIHAASRLHHELADPDSEPHLAESPAFDTRSAALASDTLITKAFEIIADYQGPHVVRALRMSRLLAHATRSSHGVIGNQAQRWGVMPDPAEHDTDTTAALFEFAMRAATMATGHDQVQQDRWGEFGRHVGRSYETTDIDDLLDLLYLDDEVRGRAAQTAPEPQEGISAPSSLHASAFEDTPPSMPRHIAIIPDGNRRWARRQGFVSEYGHRHGFLTVTPELFRNAWQSGVHTMTLWLFSTENWRRSNHEVKYLMDIYTIFMGEMCELCLELDIRMVHLGRRDRIPARLRLAMMEAIEKTSHCSSGVFNIALDYGGRDEIVRGFGRLVNQGSFDAGSLDESTLQGAMDTAGQEHPEPDLILRTSGEMRMSGFMLWQNAYSEFFFIDTCYPDLTWEIVEQTISRYTARNRTYGGDSRPEPTITVIRELVATGS